MDSLRVVLLDLDGTLVDAHDAIVDGVLEVAAEAGLAVPTRDWARARIGRPPDETWVLLGAPDPARLAKRFSEVVQPRLVERTTVLPGVAEALEGLAALGLQLAVATTRGTRSARETLEATGLHRHIAAVAGRDRVATPKPAPDVLLLALADLGALAGAALMIGDTEADARAAAAAGLPCWGVLGGVGDEPSLRAAGAEHILYDGLGGAPAEIGRRRSRRSTTP